MTRQVLLVTHHAKEDVVGLALNSCAATRKRWSPGAEHRLPERIKHWAGQLNSFIEGGVFVTKEDLDARVGPEEDEEAVLDARIQKELLTLVKECLDGNPEWDQRFKATNDGEALNQLLTLGA